MKLIANAKVCLYNADAALTAADDIAGAWEIQETFRITAEAADAMRQQCLAHVTDPTQRAAILAINQHRIALMVSTGYYQGTPVSAPAAERADHHHED